YAAIYPTAAWVWILAPLALLALWAVALGAGVTVAMLMLRMVPARSAREALGLLSTATVFALWIANAFVLPRAALHGDPAAMLAAIRAHEAAHGGATPGAWVASMMAAASAHRVGPALLALGAALAAAGGALLVAGAVAGA